MWLLKFRSESMTALRFLSWFAEHRTLTQLHLAPKTVTSSFLFSVFVWSGCGWAVHISMCPLARYLTPNTHVAVSTVCECGMDGQFPPDKQVGTLCGWHPVWSPLSSVYGCVWMDESDMYYKSALSGQKEVHLPFIILAHPIIGLLNALTQCWAIDPWWYDCVYLCIVCVIMVT